jgi:hypothetical protein
MPTNRLLRSPKCMQTTTCISLPADTKRTSVSEQPSFVWCQGSSLSTPAALAPLTVQDYIPVNDQWAIQSFDCPYNGAVIAQAIIQSNAIAVCDGFYKDNFGTAGFVMQSWDQQESRIIGANVTPGHEQDQNPYCSKLGGIFAIIVIVKALTTKYDIRQGTIELGCDCESALTAIFAHTYDTPSQPHHDLIHAIRSKLATSPVTCKHRHV